ncbi:hypothetical protein H6783_01025 [Candidatus Nomurabacteria bacterium]|nr:hypothetical protein [Candidatus Nomurabacteria bacterium]
MHEAFEKPLETFKYPEIESEVGEFKRVAQTFHEDVNYLISAAHLGELVVLDDKIWDTLENTDSNSFSAGEWSAVENCAAEVNRDWRTLKAKIDSGATLDAPIIMKWGEKYHLVAGNTRLMVARAMGLTPKVLLFEIKTPSKAGALD